MSLLRYALCAAVFCTLALTLSVCETCPWHLKPELQGWYDKTKKLCFTWHGFVDTNFTSYIDSAIVCNSMYSGRMHAFRTQEVRQTKSQHEFNIPAEISNLVKTERPKFYSGMRIVAISDKKNTTAKRTMVLMLRDGYYNDTELSVINMGQEWTPKNAFGLSKAHFQNLFNNHYKLPACLLMGWHVNTFKLDDVGNCDSPIDHVLCETAELKGCIKTNTKDKDGWFTCNCRPNYFGRFCQFFEEPKEKEDETQRMLVNIMLVGFGSFLFLFCCFAILIRQRLMRKRKRRHERMKKLAEKKRAYRGLDVLESFSSQMSTIFGKHK
ncbi:hypothetical protein M514_04979 [Trichuris suis]|uniref:EGF-like domain-containing protein n=1 Tax=Trichuris suis TaxID=68888 RepID=A0A085MAF6_9BILA|nr:hypothetical protein M513_04979 [Trichuris suis]KFD71173.1 hypothetical protein M514_04979 [Trichuris suis]